MRSVQMASHSRKEGVSISTTVILCLIERVFINKSLDPNQPLVHLYHSLFLYTPETYLSLSLLISFSFSLYDQVEIYLGLGFNFLLTLHLPVFTAWLHVHSFLKTCILLFSWQYFFLNFLYNSAVIIKVNVWQD